MNFGPHITAVPFERYYKPNGPNLFEEDSYLDLCSFPTASQTACVSARKNKIQFNEDIIICEFKRGDPPTKIRNHIDEIKNLPKLMWVHPQIKAANQKMIY
ncbi:hypothetical protein pb186bvf_011650 [Paramecium bursaria]